MFSLFLLMSGYFRSASTLPYPLRYGNYALVTYYGAEVLAVNEFHELDLECPQDQSINGMQGFFFLVGYMRLTARGTKKALAPIPTAMPS